MTNATATDPSTTTNHDPITETLRKYTTCDVSDALCELGHLDGGFLPGITMWSPQRQTGTTKIVGPAYTIEYVREEDPRPKHPNHYIDSVPAGCVIVISSPFKMSNAVYGGLMSTRARARGAVGTIVDGRFRDLDEQRALDYPVFARDVGTASPYGKVKVSAVNVPVKMQDPDVDLTISPEDYIIADLNGVVLLKRELADKVIPMMAKRASIDSKIADALESGVSFTDAGQAYRNLGTT